MAKTTLKFKVGDKVKIVANESGHDFNIGEVVTITKRYVKNNNYIAEGKDNWWWIADEDIEAAE